ncbi:glycosyltransferase family 2 protein [Flavobacterium aestuarii]|uniref:glycosyltransferase family 2 protein n=1 Tax=Flavobacterium aestuarii TaxID=3149227 RepID=UPI0032B537F1
MNTDPLISVVMPVYNCALYIEDAIDSILNQTIRDFELLIIDDASTDGTSEIIKKYSDPRIRTIYKPINQGVSQATNDGFKIANGKYIARMDGDDISVKERFEKQLTVLENNPNVLVCGGLVKYLGGTNAIIPHKEKHNEIIVELLISCSICMGAAMFRRKDLEGHYYDIAKNSGEDYDFWTKIAWLGEFYNIQEVLLLYRVHETQASKKHKPQQIIDDVQIKLYLFKRINYDSCKYPDKLISKVFLLNQPIETYEFVLFLKWIKELLQLNQKNNSYPHKEFKSVIKRIIRSILFSLYFKKTSIGIDKKWRLKMLFRLPLEEIFYILEIKFREVLKKNKILK